MDKEMTDKQQPAAAPERLDLIAYNWAETLSQGEQDVLLISSIRRLRSMIDAACVQPVDGARVDRARVSYAPAALQ